MKGSVEVSIFGKDVVDTLSDSEDFGKLALVNNSPRLATIKTRENNCHFLKVNLLLQAIENCSFTFKFNLIQR